MTGLTKEDFKRMRTDADLTQKEAAQLLGISVGSVQNYESGYTFPQGRILERYSDLALLAYEFKKEQKTTCPLRPYYDRLKTIEFRLKENLSITQALIKEIEDEMGEDQ